MDFSRIFTDDYTLVLSAILMASLAALSLYYGLFYFLVGHYKVSKSKKMAQQPATDPPPVSVVLTAQNNSKWLKTNLVYLLEQDYPTFEVVVVDYLSTDETTFVLQLLAENYKHLKVVTFYENASGYRGKKYPMSIGIKSAKYDLLLLTEPDCMPQDLTNFGWIREMVAGYSHKNVDIVLGYCSIQSKASVFNWFQQYDNMDYSVEYLGSAILHAPFTGNGRNLSYRRRLFMKNGGFIYHYYIPDGADDMFVNQNCQRHNTAVALSPDSFISVAPHQTMAEWRSCRKHRISTHVYYNFWLKIRRLIRPLGVLFFYLSIVLLLLRDFMLWKWGAGVLFLKLAWQIVATSQATRRLGISPVVYWLSPFFEIYFVVANTILYIISLSRKINAAHGRKPISPRV